MAIDWKARALETQCENFRLASRCRALEAMRTVQRGDAAQTPCCRVLSDVDLAAEVIG